MRYRWLIGIAAVIVLAAIFFLAWRHATTPLKVHRTVIAEFPKGINSLVKTDLDGDGNPELLATCTTSWATMNGARFNGDRVWFIGDYSDIADPRIWLILSPLTKPQTTQLPYVCRLNFPKILPPLKAVPVEEGEWREFVNSREWISKRLGWLEMRDGKIHFEPFCATGSFAQQLVTNDKTALLFVFNMLKGVRSVNSSSPVHRSQHFAFRMHPDGTWQRLDPTKIHSIDNLQPTTGDFDGDGLIDKVRHQFRHKRLEVCWGNGAPATVLPVKGIDLTNLYATDVDKDGCCEIVTLTFSPNQWQLTVWQFRPTERRFVTLAQLTSPLPVQIPKSSRSLIGSTKVIPPRSLTVMFIPRFYAVDIDGDGLKEFIIVVEAFSSSPFICALLPCGYVAVQVVWWQGKNLRLRSFLPHEVAFPMLPTNLLTLNEHRLAIVEGNHQKRRPTFRLLSLRPLRVQFWETKREQRCAILRIPDGDTASDLRRWTKLAELTASPRLWGDWDRDGKLEFLFEQTFVQSPLTPHKMLAPTCHQTATHSVLYLARWDGKRWRWIKLIPPSPAKATSILPLSTQDGTAIFILWQTRDKTILERIHLCGRDEGRGS